MRAFKSVRVLLVLASVLALTSCFEGKELKSSSPSDEIESSPLGVSGAIFENGGFKVKGTSLNKVKSVRLTGGASEVELAIVSKDKSQILLAATQALTLIAGTAYSLVISTAHADTTVPIVIQIAPGFISPSAISSANATNGQVLKWNGAAWVPSSDYVGAPTSSGLLFMGYTDPFTGALGGLKGANEKCHQTFPGSHWASVEEIAKLGPEYPWTHTVWIREINGKEPTFHNTINDGYPMGSRVDNCYGWTRDSIHSTGNPTGYGPRSGPILKMDGQESIWTCNDSFRLACVK